MYSRISGYKMSRQLASCLVVNLLVLGWTMPALANNNSKGVLDKIQRRGVLTVAIRQDSPPFGFLGNNGVLQGFCLDFFSLLKQRLVDNLDRNTLSIKLLKSTPINRFSLVKNNTVDLECGPNTINSDPPEYISFSQSFFVTGTQFLVRRDEQDDFDLEQSLEGLEIGVINNTTTAKFIAERYPLASLRKFSGMTARMRGIEAVKQKRIDAIVSDGILLRAAAQQQGLSSSQYPLIPNIPLTCDRYGMIIKTQDPQWQEFVNAAIDSMEGQQVSRAWFGTAILDSAQTSTACSQITNVNQ